MSAGAIGSGGAVGDGRSYRRGTLGLAAALAWTATLVVTGTGLLRSVAGRLPERIAVHWGVDGPDRWEPIGVVVVQTGLVLLAVPVGVVLLAALLHPSVRHVLAGVATGVATVVGVLGYGTAWAQADGTTPSPAPWAVGAIAVALPVAALVGWLARPPTPTGRRAAGLPEAAPRVVGPETTRLAWVGTSRCRLGVYVAAVLLPAAVLGLLALRLSPLLLVPAAVVAVVAAGSMSARVTVNADGVALRSLGFTFRRVPLHQVSSAEVIAVAPFREFGGWGWRVALDGTRAWVTRKGPGVRLHLVGQPDFVITLDRAEEAAAIVNTLAARVR